MRSSVLRQAELATEPVNHVVETVVELPNPSYVELLTNAPRLVLRQLSIEVLRRPSPTRADALDPPAIRS